MKVLRHYLQTLGLVLLIAVLSLGRIDWIVPYVLPVTIIGVIGILTYAIITVKRRGWMMILIALMSGLFITTTASAAYKLVDCGGQHNGKSAVEMLLEGAVVGGTVQAMQDAVLGGNVFVSDFASEKIEACVVVNCINAASEMCNPSGDTYDAAIRANAFYVVANVKRMSADHATDNADGKGWGNDWIEDNMQSGTAEQKSAYERAARSSIKDASDAKSCAEEYLEHCAKIDKKNEADCRTVAQNVVQNVKNCWVCTIVDAFLMSVQRVAGYAYTALKVFAIQLLGVIFLFWIAAKVLRLIAGMGYDDHGGFLTEFLIRCITVMIAAAILHAPIVNFYSIAVSPFIQMTAALTTHISEMALQDNNGKSFFDVVNAEMGSPMVSANPKQNCLQHCANMTKNDFDYSADQLALMGGKDNVVFDAASYSGLMCLTCRAYNQVTPFTAVGESFSCYAVKNGYNIFSWLGLPIGTFPKPLYFLTGLMLTAAFGFVTLYLGFYIIDIVLKLGFVIILTPLLIVAWAFPISRDYATRGWNMLVYCLAEFIGVAIVMALYMVIFMHLFEAVPGVQGGSAEQIITLMKADDIEGLYDAFGNGFIFPLKLIVVTFMATKMLQSVGQMVSFLTGVSPGIPSVAMAVLGGMVKQGMELAGLGAGAAGKTAHSAAKKLGGKMSGVFKRRNSSDGRMAKDGGPTNTSQRAAAGVRSFSDRSRQAGTDVSKTGTSLKNQGQALADKGRQTSAAGKALSAQGGLKNRLKGAALQAKGTMQTVGGMMQKGAGAAINPIGKAMNKAGTAVAGMADKVAGKMQNIGDKRQREKEASLRADPKAAAQREKGYSKMAQGGQAMANGNIARGLGMMIRGGASVAMSKVRRLNNQGRRNAKRLKRGRPVNFIRSV